MVHLFSSIGGQLGGQLAAMVPPGYDGVMTARQWRRVHRLACCNPYASPRLSPLVWLVYDNRV